MKRTQQPGAGHATAQLGETATLPDDAAPRLTFAQVIVPHAGLAVIGKQTSTVPPAHTDALTLGAVSRQMLTVTVPVAVHPVTPGAVTV